MNHFVTLGSIPILCQQEDWVSGFRKWPFLLTFSTAFMLTYSHLFCTLISENQGLEKLRSILNLRKISGPAHLNFFQFVTWFFFQIYTINLKKTQVTNWKKTQVYWEKIQFAGTEIFLRFETDLNFTRPWFSEIKVQIKWLFNSPKIDMSLDIGRKKIEC